MTYLPVSMVESNDGNRCRNPKDANWASMFFFGRWGWDGYLLGGNPRGVMVDRIEATYDYGFGRLQGILPPHTYGGYGSTDFSTGYNAGYGAAGLMTDRFRSEGILGYQFMIDVTQSGPYSWWESCGPPEPGPWEGSHPGTGAGSCPHMWGQSAATKVLVESLIAESADGRVMIGRGIPADWIREGQVIAVSRYPITGGRRMGFRLKVLDGSILLQLTGDDPLGDVRLDLEALAGKIRDATCGTFDDEAGFVVVPPSTDSVTVHLGEEGEVP